MNEKRKKMRGNFSVKTNIYNKGNYPPIKASVVTNIMGLYKSLQQ